MLHRDIICDLNMTPGLCSDLFIPSEEMDTSDWVTPNVPDRFKGGELMLPSVTTLRKRFEKFYIDDAIQDVTSETK